MPDYPCEHSLIARRWEIRARAWSIIAFALAGILALAMIQNSELKAHQKFGSSQAPLAR